MAKQHDDQYWMDLIKKCRTSGLSDYEWCRQNHIPSSTFYYHIKIPRRKACSLLEPAPAEVSVKQDVVQVFVSPEETTGAQLISWSASASVGSLAKTVSSDSVKFSVAS